MNTGKLILSFALTSLFFLNGCSSSREVFSTSAENIVTIDGNQNDWNNLTYIQGENISFGFKNDSDNLFICLVTSDRNKIMKIFRGGLTIWLETENSDNKIGVRYPDKADPSDLMQLRHDNNEMQQQQVDDSRLKMFLSAQNELYIVKESNFVLNAFPINSDQYKAKIDITDGKFFYELKIPFDKESKIKSALKSQPGKTIEVVFETGEIEKPGMNRMRPEGMDERDEEQMPGNMGNHPDGRDFGRGPGMNMDTSPMKYKFRLRMN
jgi:hypothetical protein